MAQQLELGLDTFGDVTVDAKGDPLPAGQVIRNVVEEGVLADRLGVDFFGVGEHHRADYAISAPEIVLAAIAARTERIRLGTAVTVLSSDDPVRVFERFATLDALSQGRAEIILGRGSFTESFPLFGYDLAKYEVLFEEKIELLTQLLTEKPVTWSGTTRAGLTEQEVYPKTESGSIRTWVGVGGSPESVVRAARYGLPLVLAIIGGEPERFAPYVELFHRALAQFGKDDLPVAVHSPGYIAETDQQALDELWPHYEVDAQPDRRRARLGSDQPRSLRARGHPRRALRGFARDRGPEDRVDGPRARHPALRPQVQLRHATARAADDRDRALRHRRHPAGARAARRGLTGADMPGPRHPLAHWRGRVWAVLRDYPTTLRDPGVELSQLVPARRASPEGDKRPVVILPGVYETWHYLRPVAEALNRAGHPIHLVHGARLQSPADPVVGREGLAHCSSIATCTTSRSWRTARAASSESSCSPSTTRSTGSIA